MKSPSFGVCRVQSNAAYIPENGSRGIDSKNTIILSGCSTVEIVNDVPTTLVGYEMDDITVTPFHSEKDSLPEFDEEAVSKVNLLSC